MSIKSFVNACELQLRRVENVVNQPLKFQQELKEFEELLRKEWPDAIIELQDAGLKDQDKEEIQKIFKKIKELETKAQTRGSFFDGIEDFMQKSRNR